MKITINAIDKMVIKRLLPQTESILIQTMARDIDRKIELTKKDRETIDLKPAPQDGIAWKPEKVSKTETEIEFSEAEIRMLQKEIKKFDEAKKVSVFMLDTYLKIQDIKIKEKNR